ncbi:hypothetical protein [Cellulomonas sp. URHD0024]|uniref:hypothetical protein n=1 Tax=Cellulomonas sp. URHD0024 TaxID=1302620 RepID=UPI0004236C21|nr:hypothetical protein [Cellulomonas sp. URHD0024]
MSEQTATNDDDAMRAHAQEPAEGDAPGEAEDTGGRHHPSEPAEGEDLPDL